MVKEKFTTFIIDAGTYSVNINFCISKDLKRACKWINWKLELPTPTELPVVEADLKCLGKRILIPDYCPMIWLPEIPTTPLQFGTAQHEIFHAVCDVMRWAHIPLTNSSEEAYCHLIKYVTTKFLIQIKSK